MRWAAAPQPGRRLRRRPFAADSANPISIGASLSLSGDFSDDGKAFQQGYQLWADMVNKNGGLLGRMIQMDIVSDASSTDQVQTNYQKLINVNDGVGEPNFRLSLPFPP